MENEPLQVQAVRPVNKDSLDSAVHSTPAPRIIYFDCHVDPATKKGFVLWDDIRLAFSDALYIRHLDKVVPFMKGIDFMPLQPLRIAATPEVVLDVVVDSQLPRPEAAISHVPAHTTVLDTSKKSTAQEEAAAQKEASANSTIAAAITETRTTTVGRNPAYGLVEAAMQNYNHIDNPAFGPQSRAPQFIPSSNSNHSNSDGSTNSRVLIHEQPASNGPPIDIKPPQAPQGRTTSTGDKDISPIVVKATLGDVNSQVELGNMYKIGDGVEQDYEGARYWYLKAANQGDAFAQCSIGDLYRLGLGVDFNHSTALCWYQKAADQGDASGQYNLGLVYEYGLALEMDYAVAMDWYRKSADQGYAPAQCSIGELYSKGRGVPQDYPKSMEWYLLAARQDLPMSQVNMGLRYISGRGVTKDEGVALEWFHKASARRDTDAVAQFSMGYILCEGLGTPQNYSKAREWFQKSARQGLPEAQHLIADFYLYGNGVPQDFSEAMTWYRKAADQHLPHTQLTIGQMYHYGLGVLKDYSIAKEWYAKAARQELPDAKEAMVELQQLMDKEEEEKKLRKEEEENLKKEEKATLKKAEENKEARLGDLGDSMIQRHTIVEKTTEGKKKQTFFRFKFW